ncbi:MAG: DedA family protein [Bdellovibrionales bacterium]|nr:DedA family protein [Bdellovibrionales bacterium]
MFTQLIDIFLHLDVHLAELAQMMGLLTYVILFLIIFAETGLVVTPLLPGDSLLFAAGALCAVEGSGLNVHLMAGLLFVAAVSGDASNYVIGRYLAPKIFTSERSWLLNRNHLRKTEEFYKKYGPFTVVIARFVPIVRTFAPFVTGMSRMPFGRYIPFNLLGASTWVLGFTYAGYVFGNVPAIKRNFHIVVVAIIVLSVLPIVIEWFKHRRAKNLTN